jgi:hypothetical protein
MTVLVANVPHETDLGFVDVENPFPPGRYRIRLTVFDEAKNESEPAFILLTVNEAQREPRGPIGRIPIDRIPIDRVIDRGILNPDIGEAVRPVRPIFPRRPGG